MWQHILTFLDMCCVLLPLYFFFFIPLIVSLSLQGHCIITLQLSDEELAADYEGVDYFLLFAGSTQRHLTSALRSSHGILQALCPGEPPHPQSEGSSASAINTHNLIYPVVPVVDFFMLSNVSFVVP